MPVPTVYTESALADYLASVLGELAPLLGWDAGSAQVREAVSDALLDLGTTDISTVTTTRAMRGLRALGRRAIWRAVVQATAGKYDFADSDAKFTRSQMHDQARNALNVAQADCLEFDPGNAVEVVKLSRPQDPYVVMPDSERTI